MLKKLCRLENTSQTQNVLLNDEWILWPHPAPHVLWVELGVLKKRETTTTKKKQHENSGYYFLVCENIQTPKGAPKNVKLGNNSNKSFKFQQALKYNICKWASAPSQPIVSPPFFSLKNGDMVKHAIVLALQRHLVPLWATWSFQRAS